MIKLFKKILFYLPFILIIILLLLKFQIIKPDEFSSFYLINDMFYQNKYKPQTESKSLKNKKSIFNDSINPNNSNWYFLDPTQYEIAEKKVLASDTFSLERGRLLYERNCIICHDSSGKGNGFIISKVELDSLEEGFPNPQDLTRNITKDFSKARLFHILSSGQNLMFSVAHKISIEDRWNLVNYIHKLQNK